MRILVTGATGFVGRALVRRLVETGAHDVVAVCRQPPVHAVEGAHWVRVPDLVTADDLQSHLEAVDAVVHLAGSAAGDGGEHTRSPGPDRDRPRAAAVARPPGSMRSPNVAMTSRLAEAARTAGVRRFVFVSSAKVHGETTGSGKWNEDSPLEPSDAYARSKVEAEDLVKATAVGSTMDFVIVRPAMVYGPEARGNFRRLCALARLPVPLPFGAILNARSMVFVENLVGMLILCLERPSAGGEAFLVADGEDSSTPDLILRLAEAQGRRARLFGVSPGALKAVGRAFGRESLVERLTDSLRLDSSKARRVLDWQPEFEVAEALRVSARGRGANAVGDGA